MANIKSYEVQLSRERLYRFNFDFLVVQLIGGHMVGLMSSNLNIALEREEIANTLRGTGDDIGTGPPFFKCPG
jgi:hypothetical protein